MAIRDQIAQTIDIAIDAGIEPFRTLVQNKSKTLSEQQTAFKGIISRNLDDIQCSTARSLETQTLESRRQVSSLEAKMEVLNTTVRLLALSYVRNDFSQVTDVLASEQTGQPVQIFLQNVWHFLVHLQGVIHKLM